MAIANSKPLVLDHNAELRYLSETRKTEALSVQFILFGPATCIALGIVTLGTTYVPGTFSHFAFRISHFTFAGNPERVLGHSPFHASLGIIPGTGQTTWSSILVRHSTKRIVTPVLATFRCLLRVRQTRPIDQTFFHLLYFTEYLGILFLASARNKASIFLSCQQTL